jgi:recombination protein RecA
MMSESTAALLERLRGHIRTLEAQPRQVLLALRTGVAGLDELGVFRLGGGVELCGEEASGRTTLALSVVAAACREKRLSAWVDGPGELYPPAAVSLGVELERLLIVRPKAPKQLVWSAVQLLRSGAFCCVVLDLTHTGVLPSLTDAKKLADAARAGGSLLVLLTSKAAPAQGLVRLMLRPHSDGARSVGGHLRCVEGGRSAGAGAGAGTVSPETGPMPPESGSGGPPAEVPGVVRDGAKAALSQIPRPRLGALPDLAQARPGPPIAKAPESDSFGLGSSDFTFLIEAPHGRRARLDRARLTRDWVPSRRSRAVGAAPGPIQVTAASEALVRPKKNLDRDGWAGAIHGRPGRDGPLSLPASIAAARSWR